ncbi:MAG: hypothetical protein KBT35_01275 [Firmicutes bacterium]|nr:hypothetical protein [Candidatus Colivicinus equi]
MESIKTKPLEIWSEYTKLKEYLERNNVYEIVKTNEKFYEGKQWEGCKADNMPKPVFNVLQRTGKFMVATISSNDIAIQMVPFTEVKDDIDRMSVVAKQIDDIIEVARIKEATKLVIRNAYVDGSSYMLQTFNPNVETGQLAKGVVENQVIDNTNMYFGNPYSNVIQKQPYIIVALRQHKSQVINEARQYGVSEDEIEQIVPENDSLQANDDSDDLVTVILKFYRNTTEEIETIKEIDKYTGQEYEIKKKKVRDTIWFTKTTQYVTLIGPTDLGYKRYPISCFGWDEVKNSYLYTSPMTSVIPNQIFINKVFSIAQMYGLQSAFPKLVYDKSKIDIEEFMGATAQAVAGIDLMGKFMDFIKVPDFSNNIVDLARETIGQTKECMGVTDASLGNVKPDNTSAIIALQESSSVPLELQKQAFFQFWEDTVRNIIDIVACSYGERQVMTEDNQLATCDFSKLKDVNFNLKVEIGNGAQYSEIAQINTLDKLVQAGFITPEAYMKAIPNKYIPQKQMLIDSYREIASQGIQPQSFGSTPANETKPI